MGTEGHRSPFLDLQKILKARVLEVFLIAATLWVLILGISLYAIDEGLDFETDTLKTLKRIYDEVKEMGPYPGQTFTQQEFFAGGPDDDDTNKNQHVVVLIQNIDGLEKMKIQVTYMEPTKHDANIKYAKETKNISCILAGDKIQVQSTDFGENEMGKLVPDILRAIVNKKKLLRDRKGE